MKAIISIGALAIVLVGCGQGDQSSDQSGGPSAGQNPLNAPADYANAMVKAKTGAEKTVDTAALNQAVQMFHVQEGRYPKDLKELVDQKYLPRIPEPPAGMKIEYDAKTGSVKVVRQ